MNIKKIYSNEEFEQLKERAQQVNSGRIRKRKEEQKRYDLVKELVSTILTTMDTVKLYGEVVNRIRICRLKGNIVIQIDTDRGSNYQNTQVTKCLEKLVNRNNWDEEVWEAVCDIFNEFQNYEASYNNDLQLVQISFSK